MFLLSLTMQQWTLEYTSPFKVHEWALAGVAHWTEHWPMNRKVACSIPSQGTCLDSGRGPWEATNQCFSHIDVPLPFSLPSPHSKNK